MLKSIRSQHVRFVKNCDILIDKNYVLAPNSEVSMLATSAKKEKTPFDMVAEQYMTQLTTTPNKAALNALYKAIKNGKNVVIVNYNNGGENCWSTVLMGMLQGAGIKTDDEPDYSAYYAKFKTLDAKQHA